MSRLLGAATSLSILLAAPAFAQSMPDTRPAGNSAIESSAIATAAAELPRLRSLLVSLRGELVFERYFHGARPATPANIKSASKTIVSALVGIAVDRGLIPGVQQTIDRYFPDMLAGDANAARRRITIEQLLTMQSGLASTSNRNYGAWVVSANWVRHALTRPLDHAPGTYMTYSTGNTHLLSAVLTKVSGTSTWRFAQDALATPLGFTLAQWPRDPQGVYFGGNDMLLTPRQMVAFGELYLRRGRVADRQVVPAAWVDASFVQRTRSNISGELYGYGWWIRDVAGVAVYYAWGYGGQFIFVVPALDLVVASTSTSTTDDDRRTHRRTVDDLIERMIIEPVAAARTSSVAR